MQAKTAWTALRWCWGFWGVSVASATTTDSPGQKLQNRPRKIIGTYGVDDGRRKDLSHAERIKDDERNKGLTLCIHEVC